MDDPGDPAPPSMPQGKGKPSLSMGDLVGVEGAALGGVLGRYRRVPLQRASPAPQAVIDPGGIA